jgi:23S rRNA pseudouridine1911/1915/1917 synthase
MTEAWEIVVTAEYDGERIDRFLRRAGRSASRAALAEQLERGEIRVNGARFKKGQRVRAGDRVSGVRETRPPAAEPDPELPLEVLHEDAWLVVANKPAGVPSHPLRGEERGTLASALLARYPEMAGVGHAALEPGILHRLDTGTSGVLLAARDAETFRALHEAHQRGELDKHYLALCSGQLQAPRRVHGYLRADRKRVRVDADPFEGAKPIETELLRAEAHGELCLVEVRVPFAGRHQVRAQLAALGHPIAGDTLYGGPQLPGLTRHFLHASELGLRHPRTGQRLRVQAPLPADLEAQLK